MPRASRLDMMCWVASLLSHKYGDNRKLGEID
jgi:hypothetical protein